MMGKINLDDGFSFGIGVFETMAVVNGKVIFADRHLQRIQKGLAALEINEPKELVNYFQEEDNEYPNGVKKVAVSADNIIINYRDNPYTKADYERGFKLEIAKVRRNETSPFTYVKSLSCGDNIILKRQALKRGIDEVVFLNSRGEFSEGAVTNIFFAKGDQIYTPPVECGLLPGTMREWILAEFAVKEQVINQQDIVKFDEMFVTNSLLGIMPVISLGEVGFKYNDNAKLITKRYEMIAK
jgi:Branched-chain amino acid aminotransferase/4-amino-4-deoxychorismate lyase